MEKNIDNLTPKYILTTQILNAEFCAKYILSEEYHWKEEEKYYCCDFDRVLKLQPHINKEELLYYDMIYNSDDK